MPIMSIRYSAPLIVMFFQSCTFHSCGICLLWQAAMICAHDHPANPTGFSIHLGLLPLIQIPPP
nr:MAG TPA: hypothetical protein [Bacteriophage sp.]